MSRRAPAPLHPPQAHLPEDFNYASQPGRDHGPQSPASLQLQARKREMENELEQQLKQLDSERKEGLYRLDWELAEAIEALHAKHAERANKMISQHKETISMMEKRAQAGEPLTPQTAQGMRSSGKPALVSTRSHVTEEEESEEESEDEGLFSRFVNMIREIAPVGSMEENGQYGMQKGMQQGRGSYQRSPPTSPSNPKQRMEGAPGSPQARNGYSGHIDTDKTKSPTANEPSIPPLMTAGDLSMSPFNSSLPPLASLGSPWPPANVYNKGGLQTNGGYHRPYF